jgi:hypothetical protein
MWTLVFGHHEDRTPMHGYAETREILKTSGAEPVFPDQLAILKN